MMDKRNSVFPLLLLCILTGMGIFHFWMAYPGIFLGSDTVLSLFLVKNNWHPVIISYLLEILYTLFGAHVWWYLILELFPFYMGLFLIIYGFYRRFRTWKSLFLIFPAFIGNIFFINFHLQSSTFSPMWIFLLYSLVLYRLLNVETAHRYLWRILICLVFMIALLSRHNALFAVWPVCLIWIFEGYKKYRLKPRTIVGGVLGSMLLTLLLAVGVPKVLQTDKAYPDHQLILHQMAGACVPSNDSSCFKKEWYLKGKTWDDVKKVYLYFPTTSDWLAGPQNIGKTSTFIYPIKGLYPYWIAAIQKHPKDYLRYILNVSYQVIFQKFNLQLIETLHFSHEKLDEHHLLESNTRLIPFLKKFFPEHELKRQFTPLQDWIFVYLWISLPTIDPIYFITATILFGLAGFALMCFSGYDKFLMFSLSASLGGMGLLFMNCLFSPNVLYRYIHSVLIMCILSLLGLICYSYNKFREKRQSVLDKQ